MNSFAGKAAIFTQGAMATLKKQTDPAAASAGVEVPPESPVTPNGDSSKKKKKKNKKRNSKTTLVEENEEDDDATATGSTASAASSEPSPVAPSLLQEEVVEVAAVEALTTVKEDPFAASLLDLPSPVAAPAASVMNGVGPFDVFDKPPAAPSPAAPVASGLHGEFDWTAPPPAPVSAVNAPVAASVVEPTTEPPASPVPVPVAAPVAQAPVYEPLLTPLQAPEPAAEKPVVAESPVVPAPAPVEDLAAFFASPPPAPAATEIASKPSVASVASPQASPSPFTLEPSPQEQLVLPTSEPSSVSEAAAVVTVTTSSENKIPSEIAAAGTTETVEEGEPAREDAAVAPAIEGEDDEIDAPIEVEEEADVDAEFEAEVLAEEEIAGEETLAQFDEESELGTVHAVEAEDVALHVTVPDSNEGHAAKERDETVASPIIVDEAPASPTPALAPSPTVTKSTSASPKPTSASPKPTSASPKPTSASPKPTSASPKPTTASPKPIAASSKAQSARVGGSASTATSKASTNGAPAARPRTVPAPKPTTGPVTKPSTSAASAAVVAPKQTTSTTTKKPTLQRALSGPAVVRRPTKSPQKSGATSPSGLTSASPKAASSPVGDDGELRPVKKKLSASEIDAAGNRLYEQAMESKRRLEARKAKLEEEFTFTPQVNAKSKKLDTTDAPDRFALLHERAKESQRKKEELREKLEKEHTFKPQITAKAKKIGSNTDRFENLYKNAQEIQAKRGEKKKQELEKKEETYTFKPKINTTKSPVKSRPLYDPEVVKQKRLELEQKKMEAELQNKPKVIKKVRADDGDNKIFDRLYQGSQQRAERIAKLKQEREDQERANTTFQPKVSAAAASTKTSKQPFHTRLYDKDHLKKVAAEREQKKLEEERQQFSFKPKVSEMPDSVKSKGSQEGSTGKSSIFERLYQDKDRVKEKIEMSEELKIQKEMEECTFRPSIDVPPAGSAKSESATPIWERLLSVDKNQIVEERERLKELQELEACTFRPEISPTPGSLSPKRASTNNIFDRLSISGGNTPVDELKRRSSERKPSSLGAQGKRNSYNERVSPKPQESSSQRRVLSVGDILKSSKLSATDEDTNLALHTNSEATKSQKGGSPTHAELDPADNVTRSLEMELNEEVQPLTTGNFDSWAAGELERVGKL